MLAGVSDCVIQKMRYLQNSAARELTGSRKFEHITPILRDLHWLPVTSRVDFKILLLTYKALRGKAPVVKRFSRESVDRQTDGWTDGRTLPSTLSSYCAIDKNAGSEYLEMRIL